MKTLKKESNFVSDFSVAAIKLDTVGKKPYRLMRREDSSLGISYLSMIFSTSYDEKFEDTQFKEYAMIPPCRRKTTQE